MELQQSDDVIVWDQGDGLLVIDYSGYRVRTKRCPSDARARLLVSLDRFVEGRESEEDVARLLEYGVLEHRAVTMGSRVRTVLVDVLARQRRPDRVDIGLAAGQGRSAVLWLRAWLLAPERQVGAVAVRLSPGRTEPPFEELSRLVRQINESQAEGRSVSWEVELPEGTALDRDLELLLDGCPSIRPVLVDWTEVTGADSNRVLTQELVDRGYEPILEIPTRLERQSLERIKMRVLRNEGCGVVVTPLFLERFRGRGVHPIGTEDEFSDALETLLRLGGELDDVVVQCEPWRSLMIHAGLSRPLREGAPHWAQFAYLRDGTRFRSRDHAEWDLRTPELAETEDSEGLGCRECGFRAMCWGPWSRSSEVLRLRGEFDRASRVARYNCQFGLHWFPQILKPLTDHGEEKLLSLSQSVVSLSVESGKELRFSHASPERIQHDEKTKGLSRNPSSPRPDPEWVARH